MTRVRLEVLSIAAATCAALALSPVVAHAEKFKSVDSTGDVVLFSGQSATPAPDNIPADVRKSVTNHSAKRVKIKLRFVDLAGGPAKAGVYAPIETNKKNYAFVLKIRGLGFELTNSRATKTLKCAGKKHKVSAAKDVIKMSVPRSCLGSPRWVRVGIEAVSVVERPDLFVDDALRAGIRKNGSLTFGPKLRRN